MSDSKLEKDFEATVAQINEKIKEAATALVEANRLSEEIGLPSLIYTVSTIEDVRWDNENLSDEEIDARCDELREQLSKINVRDLERALSGGGWSTSSSYC